MYEYTITRLERYSLDHFSQKRQPSPRKNLHLVDETFEIYDSSSNSAVNISARIFPPVVTAGDITTTSGNESRIKREICAAEEIKLLSGNSTGGMRSGYISLNFRLAVEIAYP